MTPYAVRQHEDMTLQHKNGRRAKFLESAYKNNIGRIRQFLANGLEIK